jgi:hypothetical protein
MWQLLAAVLAGGATGVLGHSVLDRTTVRLEEYRVFIEDTSRYSDRRQTVSNLYVAVNTIVVTAVAVLLANGAPEAGPNLDDLRVRLVLFALPFVILAASSVWLILVHKYERIVAARLRELKRIEKELRGSHEMYRRMDEAFCGRVPSFSTLENVLPILFIVVDSILLLGLSLLPRVGLQ